MGSNVPPITPIRPPTTERAYPVPRRPTRAGRSAAAETEPPPPGGSGGGRPACDRLPRAAGRELTRRSPGANRSRGWSDGAVLPNGDGADRLRERPGYGL